MPKSYGLWTTIGLFLFIHADAMGFDTQAVDNAVVSQIHVEFGDEVVVEGNAYAGGEVRIGREASLSTDGDLTSLTDIFVGAEAVTGDLTAAGIIDLEAGASTGLVAEGVSGLAPVFLATGFASNEPFRPVGTGSACYDTGLAIARGDFLDLAEGVFFIDGDVVLQPQSELNVQGLSSMVIQGDLTLGSEAQITQGSGSDTAIGIMPGNFSAASEAQVQANVFVGGDVSIGQETWIQGAVHGFSVDIGPETIIEHQPFTGLSAVNADGPFANDVVEQERVMQHPDTSPPPFPPKPPLDVTLYVAYPDVANATFPVIPWFTGGSIRGSEYRQFCKDMASWGYVCVVVDLLRSFFGSPPALFPSCLSIESLRTHFDDEPLIQADMDTIIVGGHSLGGATALQCVGRDPDTGVPLCEGSPFCEGFDPESPLNQETIKGAVSYGGSLFNPNTGQIIPSEPVNQQFAAYIRGELDTQSDNGQVLSLSAYAANAVDEKSFWFLRGANHHTVTDNGIPDDNDRDTPEAPGFDHFKGIKLIAMLFNQQIQQLMNDDADAHRFLSNGFRGFDELEPHDQPIFCNLD